MHTCAIIVTVEKEYYLKRGEDMPIKYKIDILEALKEKGFTSYRIRKEKIFGQKTLQDFRNGNVVLSADCLEKLCSIFNCQIGDLIEYVSDDNKQE